jgi:hypothetical protein
VRKYIYHHPLVQLDFVFIRLNAHPSYLKVNGEVLIWLLSDQSIVEHSFFSLYINLCIQSIEENWLFIFILF